jgi:hypothetical protein
MNSKVFFLLVTLTGFGCSAGSGVGQLSGGDGGSGGGSGGGGGSSANSSSAGTGQGGAGDDIDSSGAGSGTGGGEDLCSDAARLIYVLSQSNELYSFQPDMKQFKKIGTLGCQAGTLSPNSMAVDRNAVAWVNYVKLSNGVATDGAIFKVSTADASCEPTSIKLQPGWFWIGMGFSTDAVEGTNETLFIAGSGTNTIKRGLAKIDFTANSVVPIGDFTGSIAGRQAELTGTGDARLFGFVTSTPVQVAELDKTTGVAKSTKSLSQVQTPAAYAFSFWGGDFYLYTAPQQQTVTTTVSRYRPSDGSVEPTYMTNIGFRIVGAGVSTCAPLEPPK